MMDTEKKKESQDKKENLKEKTLKDRVPVQQSGFYSEVTKKEIREAVNELNPDMSGLDRG